MTQIDIKYARQIDKSNQIKTKENKPKAVTETSNGQTFETSQLRKFSINVRTKVNLPSSIVFRNKEQKLLLYT